MRFNHDTNRLMKVWGASPGRKQDFDLNHFIFCFSVFLVKSHYPFKPFSFVVIREACLLDYLVWYYDKV